MKQSAPEILSIDITNQCHKGCPFCYNESNASKTGGWDGSEVIPFAISCIKGGVKCISLGGGEPFEHPQIFEIIEKLFPLTYLTITTNGLPLEDMAIQQHLIKTHPDKIHVSIHNPENKEEVERVISQLNWLKTIGIAQGVNLLVSNKNIESSKEAFCQLSEVLTPHQIILLPMRYLNTPSPDDLLMIAGNQPFQSSSCLIKCIKPDNFISISWDKKVGFCSFTRSKKKLKSLSYEGLMEAVGTLPFLSCNVADG